MRQTHLLYVRYRVPIHHPPKLIFCSAAEFYGTFVWKGSVEKYEKKLDEKVRVLIKEINTIAEQENEIYGNKDLEELGEGAEVTSKEIKEVAQKINNKLEALAENSETKAKTVKKKLEKAKKELETELLPRKEKYEGYNATFNGRNSFSKTDHDATFMRRYNFGSRIRLPR